MHTVFAVFLFAPFLTLVQFSDEYLTENEFSKLVRRSLRQIRRWHALRIGPPRISFLGRRGLRLYRRSAVEKWLESHEIGPLEKRRP